MEGLRGKKTTVAAAPPWPAAKREEGEEFLKLEEGRECVLTNEGFLFIPPIYTSLLLTISCQVPPNTISLHLYLTPISKVSIPLPLHEVLVPTSMVGVW